MEHDLLIVSVLPARNPRQVSAREGPTFARRRPVATEHRYLDGHPALFPNVVAAWDERLGENPGP